MKYTTLTKTDDGSLYASIRTDDDKPLIVQLNSVNLTEGSLLGEEDVWFTYTGEDVNEIVTFEDQILSDIKADPQTWFNRNVREKTIESSFTPSISQHGQFQLIKSPGLRIFDKDTKDTWEGEVSTDNVCDIIVQLQGLTFFKRSFQLVLKLHQVQVAPLADENLNCYDNWTMTDYGFAQ